MSQLSFRSGSVVRKSACQCRRCKRCRFHPTGLEDPLEKDIATHSSILVRRLPWTGAWRTVDCGVTTCRTRQSKHTLHYYLYLRELFPSLWLRMVTTEQYRPLMRKDFSPNHPLSHLLKRQRQRNKRTNENIYIAKFATQK